MGNLSIFTRNRIICVSPLFLHPWARLLRRRAPNTPGAPCAILAGAGEIAGRCARVCRIRARGEDGPFANRWEKRSFHSITAGGEETAAFTLDPSFDSMGKPRILSYRLQPARDEPLSRAWRKIPESGISGRTAIAGNCAAITRGREGGGSRNSHDFRYARM